MRRCGFRNKQGPETAEYDGIPQSGRIGFVFVIVLKEKTEIPRWKNIVELATDRME